MWQRVWIQGRERSWGYLKLLLHTSCLIQVHVLRASFRHSSNLFEVIKSVCEVWGQESWGGGVRRRKETDRCLTKITSFHSMLLALLRGKLFHP